MNVGGNSRHPIKLKETLKYVIWEIFIMVYCLGSFQILLRRSHHFVTQCLNRMYPSTAYVKVGLLLRLYQRTI